MSVYGGVAGEAEVEWAQDYELSRTHASEKGVPLFIDFTGYTCTNCRAMESTVFIQPNIREKFALMEKVKLYTDGGTRADENQAFQFELTGTLRSEEHTTELQSRGHLVCRPLLEKK